MTANPEKKGLLKHLQTLLSKSRADLEAKKLEQSKIQKEMHTLRETISSLEKQIADIGKDNRVVITEHAILRYIERVKGINIKALESEIIPESTMNQIKKLKTGKFPIVQHGVSYRVIVKDLVIVTIESN